MDMAFVINRITELRMKHNLSEYQLSLDLGKSKGYIQSITSGRIKPSLPQIFIMCEYFGISVSDFFSEEDYSPLILEARNKITKLSEDQISAVIAVIDKFNEANNVR